jgi:Tol biopolymer transport system component
VTLDLGSIEEFFQVSPDGKHVVFRATRANPRVIELYSVPIDGSYPPVKLNGPFVQ